MHTQPVITMKAVTKRFPGVVANRAVDFDLLPGEVHTLLGENGAGKSTLMHILSGMIRPDSGTIEVDGEPVDIRSPADALKAGIGMVYQDFALVPSLTVAENIILGSENGLIINRKRADRKLKQILEKLSLSLPLDELTNNLSVGQRQRVEIVKAVYHGSKALILDEPTSVLSPIDTEGLFKTITSLRKQGNAVVFITHKLKEALRISDRISILKSGGKAAELKGDTLRRMDEADAQRMIFDVMFGGRRMPGRSSAERSTEKRFVLALDDVVCLGDRGAVRLKNITLKLRAGEIFGIAGVDGNGQKELAEAVSGQRRIVSGSIRLNGQDISRARGPRSRAQTEIAHITDDRMLEGCAKSMSVAENAILRHFRQPPFSRFKVLNTDSINRHAMDLVSEFNIKAGGPEVQVGTLSGGNIQKLILARELSRHPAVLVCNKPTLGLDAETTRYVQERIQEEARRGTAVLLISSDLDELLIYSLRIGVLYNGELLDILNVSDADPETIGKLMLGIRNPQM